MTPCDDVVYEDAAELARRIRARELSPVEVLRAHRERAQALGPGLNAIVTPHPEAERLAVAAEAAVLRGDDLGPLHGVPFTIKDSLDTAGVRTTRGSLLFADHVPARDAAAVTRLRTAGAIPLGKTNLPEFCLWWETDNRVFGRTVNPWDPTRTAGGSSGGEGAAIAAGLSPLGLGSDVGGSIRIPASHCGVVGFKPTHGRVPLTGHWPESLLRFMHVGPLARSVADVALALSVLGGLDALDPYGVPAPPVAADAASGGVAGLRVGVVTDDLGPVDPAVRAVVVAAGEALAGAGCVVEQLDLPWLARRDANRLTITLYGVESAGYFGDVIGDRADDLHPLLRARVGAPPPPLEAYVGAEAEVDGLRHDLARLLLDYDVLLAPTALVPAHPFDMAELAVNGEAHPPRTVMRATIPWDLTGSPALSVPFALLEGRLPVGVQVVGRRFDEATVLRVGATLERVREPAVFRPPVGA